MYLMEQTEVEKPRSGVQATRKLLMLGHPAAAVQVSERAIEGGSCATTSAGAPRRPVRVRERLIRYSERERM